MNDNIEIQQEFEHLVAELEKLRTVNQLTSTNEESARKVVERIDSLVSDLSNLLLIVKNDYDIHSEQLRKLIEKFPIAIIEESGIVIEEIREIEKKHLDTILNEYRKNVASISNHIEKQIDIDQNNRIELKKLINSEVDQYRKTINSINLEYSSRTNQISNQIKEIEDIKSDLVEYLIKIEEFDFNGRLSQMEIDLNILSKSIQETMLTNNNLQTKKIEDRITPIEKSMTDIKSQISKVNSSQENFAKRNIIFFVITWLVLSIVAFALHYFGG